MASRLQAEAFVATVRNMRQSKTLHCPRGSEQEAAVIEAELQQTRGVTVAKAFRAWRLARRRLYETTGSGIDLVPYHK